MFFSTFPSPFFFFFSFCGFFFSSSFSFFFLSLRRFVASSLLPSPRPSGGTGTGRGLGAKRGRASAAAGRGPGGGRGEAGARSRVRRPGRGYAACVGVAGSRVRRSVRRLLQGASGGWRARLQRVDRLAPEKRVGCAGCPPLFPTTVSRSCPAPAIIFAELGRPAPLGGLPHDSSCGECAGTTRRKEKKSKR